LNLKRNCLKIQFQLSQTSLGVGNLRIRRCTQLLISYEVAHWIW